MFKIFWKAPFRPSLQPLENSLTHTYVLDTILVPNVQS